jgi:3-methyladenine DNA glycosylase AlkD
MSTDFSAKRFVERLKTHRSAKELKKIQRYFLRQGEVADSFKIAKILLKDKQDLIHKATGGWLREAGKKDRQRLLGFLDKYAPTMPRTALRYAIEQLEKNQRTHYLNMKKSS